jgi:hypothetical protein
MSTLSCVESHHVFHTHMKTMTIPQYMLWVSHLNFDIVSYRQPASACLLIWLEN